MSKSQFEQVGLHPQIIEKNERLISDIKRLNILRYGDPETGQISARRRTLPTRGEVNAAEAKATRLYHAHKDEFHDQALIEDTERETL